MTSEEIQSMFQTNAAFKHCKDNDPAKVDLAIAVSTLTKKYIQENVLNEEPQMDFRTAIDVLMKTCESASLLEHEHKPNGMTDEDVMALIANRRAALEFLLENMNH